MTSGRWADSTRSSRLPPDWPKLVQLVKARAHGRCQGCDIPVSYKMGNRWVGGEVDHRRPGDDHSLGNLQLLCVPCHRTKTQAEANATRSRRHRTEPDHPGLRNRA